jgi:hypothetical protein
MFWATSDADAIANAAGLETVKVAVWVERERDRKTGTEAVADAAVLRASV